MAHFGSSDRHSEFEFEEMYRANANVNAGGLQPEFKPHVLVNPTPDNQFLWDHTSDSMLGFLDSEASLFNLGMDQGASVFASEGSLGFWPESSHNGPGPQKRSSSAMSATSSSSLAAPKAKKSAALNPALEVINNHPKSKSSSPDFEWTLNVPPEPDHEPSLFRMTPAQMMLDMSAIHTPTSPSETSLIDPVQPPTTNALPPNFSQYRSNSLHLLESPLFSHQAPLSPFAFSPLMIPSVQQTPSFTSSNTLSSALSATMSNIHLNPTMFNQLLVSPALDPSYGSTLSPFSPAMLPDSSWSLAIPQHQQQQQYQQLHQTMPMTMSPMMNPHEVGFGALDAPDTSPRDARNPAVETPLVAKNKCGRKRRAPVILSPEEDLLLKSTRKETEKLRRAAMKAGFDELQLMLPRDWVTNKAPNQARLLELVLLYIEGLEQEEREKREVVRRLEEEFIRGRTCTQIHSQRNQKLRRAAMKSAFDELKELLPRDWITNKAPNQARLLELVLRYIDSLVQEEREKRVVVAQ
ncbi:hypothetical protein HDU98_007621 [Podochytrium sp. JEL0797]|nr:hypothetical protein HDU98_007621 [Podochytrium sp. JEL0797]